MRRYLRWLVATWALGLWGAQAVAQEAKTPHRVPLLSIGVGMADPTDPGTSGGLLAVVGFRYPLTPWLAVEPEVGYWERSARTDVWVSDVFSDFNIGLRGLLTAPVGRTLGFYAGVGVDVHVLTGEFRVTGFPTAEETQTRTGFHILGGTEFYLGRDVR
ncbi:MAG: porin family protein, partial [Acidobacteria bacterium]|nr:porin family protein [Acidobacteriota bacterium]